MGERSRTESAVMAAVMVETESIVTKLRQTPMPTTSPLRIWDISQTLRPGLPVWPGDTAFVHRQRWSMAEGSPVNVGAFETTVHAGAHADAPLHYQAGGASAAEVALEAYIGPCTVVDARCCGAAITRDFVEDALPTPAKRVLFRTYERFPHDAWTSDFVAVDAAAIEWLAARGVMLIGVDS